MRRATNRLKICLIETKRSSKWLAAELNVTNTTVSRWCCNTMQPSIEKLYEIAHVMNIDVRRLLEPNRKPPEKR